MKIACIGEAMIELSMAADEVQLGFAGDTLNTAIYLKRSAPTLDVQFVTALGSDNFSMRMMDFFNKNKIMTDAVQTVQGKSPGLYAIETDASGERAFTYWRSNSAARMLFQREQGLDFSAIASADIIYLSAISLAILPHNVRLALRDVISASKAQFAFDSNYRPALWENAETARTTVASFWDITDICLPSIDDEMSLFGETAAQVENRFIEMNRNGALKRGANGPLSLTPLESEIEFTKVDKVTDTTAAGDSFNGGYLAAVLTGHCQEKALLNAHNLSCEVISQRGAIIPET